MRMLSSVMKMGFFLIGALCLVGLPVEAWAQSVNVDLGQGPTTTGRLVQIILLMTVLALAPSILMMVTSFTRIVVVMSFLRSAIGVQQVPPNIVLVSLSLFLTMFIMQPVFEKSWDTGIRPLMNAEIDEETAFTRSVEPFHAFMIRHTRDKDLALFQDIAAAKASPDADKAKASGAQKDTAAVQKAAATPAPSATPAEKTAAEEAVSLRVLIPAFMISELRRAFEIGFLIFMPFLIIDMVIASILMSMGMMMLPPSVISLPFKIIFFVLVDGWYMICGSLVQSYG